MRDNRGKPQKSGWTFAFGSPWKPGPDKRDEPPADYEPFPRLGASEEPPASGGKINGGWGWVLLVVPVVLLMAFAFVPTAEMAEEESTSSGLEVAVFLLVWFGPYVAGAFFAFLGNRKGITWTFPVTCIFTVFIFIVPLDGSLGAWAAGMYGLGAAGFATHYAARRLARVRPIENAPTTNYA